MNRKVVEANIETFSFISEGHGLPLQNIRINFDPSKFNMVGDPDSRARIENNWKTSLDKNPRIYNKSKFRLDNYRFQESTKILELDIGLTDYKDLHGTNLVESSSDFIDHNEIDGRRFKKMSQAIGVGGWVITSDKKFFLIHNAEWKGEQGGKLDRPGGHPEPQEAVREFGLSTEGALKEDHVKLEIFSSEQKEIRDEINIPLKNQNKQELLGVVFNLDKGGRVGLEFKIEVDLTSEEVLQLYRSGDQLEADESTGLIFFDLADSTKLDSSVVRRLTPHATGSLRFLNQIESTLLNQ